MTEPLKRILGVPFYVGDLPGLLDRAMRPGLIVVPSAPVLAEMPGNDRHREAVQESDLAVLDSGFLVLIWRILKKEKLPRISGLRFLQGLLERPEFRKPGATFWVMPSAEDAAANRRWLNTRGLAVGEDDCYVAPKYKPTGRLFDFALTVRIETKRPRFVVICLGGGVQERLGYALRNGLSHHPSVICTGAAIAFLSGRQTNIPPWADRMFLGWLLRCLSAPRRYVPRYMKAMQLFRLVRRTHCRKEAARA